MKTARTILGVFGLSMAVATVLAGDEIALFSSSIIEGNQSHSGPLGTDITVKKPIRITDIGAFESNPKGPFVIKVAIYDTSTKDFASGTQIYEVTRDNSRLEDQYRYLPIKPLVLKPGSYILVAQGFSNDQQNGNKWCGGEGPKVHGGDVVVVGSSYYADGRISFPTIPDKNQNAYHFANLKFTEFDSDNSEGGQTGPKLRKTQ